MRIFITSATGQVGSAVADAFRSGGHVVTALTRSTLNADRLSARGITPQPGNLARPETFALEAARHDVIVHTAFEYDASGNEMTGTDQRSVRALIDAGRQAGTAPHLIYTSSAFLLGGIAGDPLDEYTGTATARADARWRLAVEEEVVGARAIVGTAVRLGVVYGGNSMTLGELFSSCEENGAVTYAGEPGHRWPFIYRHDVASLYVAIAEARAAGIFHAVDGSPLTLSSVARLASTAAGCAGAVRPVEPRKDDPHALRISYDVPVISRRSRELGWRPGLASLAEGIDIAWREWRESSGRTATRE